MFNQQYSLRWNNHQPNFISMFSSLLSTKTLVDVTLAAEGKQMCAHKVVLSACSTYFQSLFAENPSTHPIVILNDVSLADLQIMVDFMYYGEVNVTEAQLPKVLETARMLKIKGLTEMPENTSLTRFQGSAADRALGPDYHASDSESHLSFSPPSSPHSPLLPGITAHKRKRRRKLSSGLNRIHDISQEVKNDEAGPSLNMVQSETVTLSSLPQQKHTWDTEDRHLCVNTPQTHPGHNLNMETMHPDHHPGMSQGGQWSMMDHTYPRYTNACVSGGMQGDTGMSVNNVLNQHVDEFNGQGLGVGPSCKAEQLSQPSESPVQTKRRRTTNPQSEENFQRALEAVRFGGIGFCKAARIFGVNNRTLWLEYKKKGYPNNRLSIKSRIKREHTTPPTDHKFASLQCMPATPEASAPCNYNPTLNPRRAPLLVISSADIAVPNIAAENLVIEGPLNVTENLPFLGTVALDGSIQVDGQSNVIYGCGNGNVGIITEGLRCH